MDRPTWFDPDLRLDLAALVDLSILGFKVGCRHSCLNLYCLIVTTS